MHGMAAIYRRRWAFFPSLAAAFALTTGAAAQAPPTESATLSIKTPVDEWTALADLALASDVILRGTVTRTQRIRGAAAAGVPAGSQLLLVTMQLSDALKTPGLVPARAEWLWQGPRATAAQPPVAKGNDVLVFLSAPAAGQQAETAQYRLRAPGGQLAWTAEGDAAVRRILADAAIAGAPMVNGIGDAFRTDGTVAGQSESQFFLETQQGSPLTLIVTRVPGAPPDVRTASGDLIGASAAPVAPRTLLWRALACGLPETLPPRLAADAGLVADYAAARASIGPCGARGLPER